jgi:hypothetical protein
MLDHFESQVVAIKGTISFTFNGQCRSLMQQPQWQSMTPYPFMAALIVCMYYACSIFFVEKLQLASIKMPVFAKGEIKVTQIPPQASGS